MNIANIEAEMHKRVKIAVYLMWLAVCVGLGEQLISYGSIADFLSHLLVLIFSIAFHAYLIVGIGKGRNSARWVYFLIFCFGIVFALSNVEIYFGNLPGVVSGVSQILFRSIAFLILFSHPGNERFKTTQS